jgi:hypothetical protein
MMHGTLSDRQIAELPVNLSSLNFRDGAGKHVTVSGYREQMAEFLKDNPGFRQMRPPHPWHHRDYGGHLDGLQTAPSRRGDGRSFRGDRCGAQPAGRSLAALVEPARDFCPRAGRPRSAPGPGHRGHRDRSIRAGELLPVFAAHRHVSSMYRGG